MGALKVMTSHDGEIAYDDFSRYLSRWNWAEVDIASVCSELLMRSRVAATGAMEKGCSDVELWCTASVASHMDSRVLWRTALVADKLCIDSNVSTNINSI